MDGVIDEHDRPYSKYGHLSNSTIAHRFNFDLLGIKTIERRRLHNNRLSRKMYAITCRTSTNIQDILSEIREQFSADVLQYICVSTDACEQSVVFPRIYIQILLTRVKNKYDWFLDKITGMY